MFVPFELSQSSVADRPGVFEKIGDLGKAGVEGKAEVEGEGSMKGWFISSFTDSEIVLREGGQTAADKLSSSPAIQHSEFLFFWGGGGLKADIRFLKRSPFGRVATEDRRGAGLSFGGWRGTASKSGGMELERDEVARVRTRCATSRRDARRMGRGLTFFSGFCTGLLSTGIRVSPSSSC